MEHQPYLAVLDSEMRSRVAYVLYWTPYALLFNLHGRVSGCYTFPSESDISRLTGKCTDDFTTQFMCKQFHLNSTAESVLITVLVKTATGLRQNNIMKS